MNSVFARFSVTAVCVAGLAIVVAAKRFDRRIVDTVDVGNAESEWNHGYVGESVSTGTLDGKTFRQARGYMRYALKTFDDTPVTVAYTFVGVDTLSRSYDVVVEDSVIATRSFTAHVAPTVVEVAVPFSLTRGKTNIAVILRARGGATPALREVRTIQDHNELN